MQVPVKGVDNQYDPINFDDLYAEEYGGYGQGSGGGGGGRGMMGGRDMGGPPIGGRDMGGRDMGGRDMGRGGRPAPFGGPNARGVGMGGPPPRGGGGFGSGGGGGGGGFGGGGSRNGFGMMQENGQTEAQVTIPIDLVGRKGESVDNASVNGRSAESIGCCCCCCFTPFFPPHSQTLVLSDACIFIK
ncbi:hypothetical protein J6590_048486 [Homalodisca vitripennis]|nr:hypothetical protein J6590_048486 [Homalodisca vitripennis]